MKTFEANAEMFNSRRGCEESDENSDFNIVIDLDKSQLMQVGGGAIDCHLKLE
jgi:hypothetical protein